MSDGSGKPKGDHHMRIPAVAAAGLLVAIPACAPTANAPDSDGASRARQCFSVPQVRNFRQAGPGQVFIRVGADDVYELNAAGGCNDLDFANRLALIPDSRGLAGVRLCTDDWARIVVPGSTSPATVCRARISRKLTEAEIAALPPAHTP